MSTERRHTPGPRPKPKIRDRDLRGAKYLRSVLDLLRPLHSHQDCENRKLHFDEYVAYLLLHFFNPIVTSLRGLQQVSTLEKVQKKLGLPRFSLGSFSEAGHVFDPALLEPLLAGLVDEATAAGADPRLAALDVAATVVDGTAIRALPKMVWALWRDDEHRAAKAHVEFSLLRGVPTRATLTDHHAAETRVLRQSLAADKLYVLDRGYADYGLLAAILDARSSFLVRLPRSAVTEVLEERPLDAEARRRGVVRDVVVTLGCAASPELHGRQLRLVEVRVPDLGTLLGHPRRVVDRKTKLFRAAKAEHVLLLVTDRLDLDAALVADLYRYRWQIELFFRWFKTILRANRLLSLSQNGMTLVVYCGLIASLLITLWTHRKPTKRTYEMICLYLMGWADEGEVEAHLERLDAASL
jgi:hypothetical protein